MVIVQEVEGDSLQRHCGVEEERSTKLTVMVDKVIRGLTAYNLALLQIRTHIPAFLARQSCVYHQSIFGEEFCVGPTCVTEWTLHGR